MPIIKIENINSGWLTFSINNRSFVVSYLSNFKKEMEYLLDLPDDDMTVKRICLDGEGPMLYLTAWRVYNDLFIVWEEWTDKVETDIMRFGYEDFVKEYQSAFGKVKEAYKKDFECGLYDE